MPSRARSLVALIAGALLCGAGYADITQATDGTSVGGVYLIKKIVTEQALMAAENVDNKVSITAAFTYDPLPAAAKKKRARKGVKKPAPKPAAPPVVEKKIVPSHDCKAWMVHVNWSPRVGDKMKVADAGECRLRGSFAGR